MPKGIGYGKGSRKTGTTKSAGRSQGTSRSAAAGGNRKTPTRRTTTRTTTRRSR